MTDLLHSDLVRWVLVAQTLTLMGSAVFLHTLHGDTLPRPLLLMGRGLLAVIGLVALSTVINALTPIPPTPGVYVAAVGSLPVTVGAVVLVCRAIHDR